jgi:predicted deacylase
MKAGDLIECDAGLYGDSGEYLGIALGPAIVIDTHAGRIAEAQYVEILYGGMRAFIVHQGVVRILNEK